MSNPIAIGFVWRQAFDFPPGFFQPGDAVRADFRRFVGDDLPRAIVTHDQGTHIEGDRLFVELTKAQTTTLGDLRGGEALTSFVVVRGGKEIAIDAVISVPVVLLPTRASA